MLKDCHMVFINCFAIHPLLPVTGENVFIRDPGSATNPCFIYSLEYKAIRNSQQWRKNHLHALLLPAFLDKSDLSYGNSLRSLGNMPILQGAGFF